MFKQFSLGSFFLAFFSLIFASAVAADSGELGRFSIKSVELTSDKKLPASVAAEEERDRHLAFDRDTGTGLTLFDDAIIDLSIDAGQMVREVRVYGAAPYRLKLFRA